MRVVVLYKRDTEYGRDVEEFITNFKRQTGHDLETMDPESPEGISICGAYDILEYPALLAMTDDGQLQNSWKGLPLPTVSEVSYYYG